jgi:hypothetical protein
MMRSSTGLMVLQQGTILAKWSARDAINASQLQKNMTEVILLRKHKLQEWFIVVLLASFLIILYMNFIRVFRQSNG